MCDDVWHVFRGDRHISSIEIRIEKEPRCTIFTHTPPPPYTDFKDFWTNDMTILGMLSRVRPLFCGLRAFSLISFVQEIPRLAQALDKRLAVKEEKAATGARNERG
jgi:hypothetical protein